VIEAVVFDVDDSLVDFDAGAHVAPWPRYRN